MTNNRAIQHLQMAVRYESRARNYLRQADLILERDADTDCAAALLYEAAKQCINAVANQRGSNPGTTGAKIDALSDIAADETNGDDLIQGWEGAAKLHIHADRGHLADVDFAGYWDDAQAFIAAMLAIYNRNA